MGTIVPRCTMTSRYSDLVSHLVSDILNRYRVGLGGLEEIRRGRDKTFRRQSLWMNLALARHSDEELRNSCAITGRPEFAQLRKYFRAAIRQLQILYTGVPDTLLPRSPMLSLCHQICTEIDTHSTLSDSSQFDDTQVVEAMDHSPATSSTIDALVRPLTPANKSLRFLESGAVGSPPTFSQIPGI